MSRQMKINNRERTKDESKQSSPIGDVEQAAKDYAERVCNGEFPIEYTREQVVRHTAEDYSAGMQYFKKCVLGVLQENLNATKSGLVPEDKVRPAEEMLIETYEDLILIFSSKLTGSQWASPAHPTAVNGDDEIALLNEIIKKQHELILSGERRGYEKAKQEFQPKAAAPKGDELREAAEGICKNFGRLTLTEIQTILSNALNSQPKAAAPKADVKSAEDFWYDHCFITDEGFVINKEDFLAYANQFKSQPQETK